MESYSDEEIQYSIEEYDKFCGKRVENNQIVCLGSRSFVGSFERKSMKRGFYKDGCFSANILRCAMTDSTFNNVTFCNYMFDRVNLQFCTFYKCSFVSDHQITLIGNNLDNSVFNNTVFKNMEFSSCGLSASCFNECFFENCKISSCTLESTIFMQCRFENCDFSNLNIEYSFFTKCQYKNMIFPVSQAPYIFGFDMFIKDEEVLYSNDVGIMKNNDYFQKAISFIPFHIKHKQYFPVVNLLLSQKKFDEAYEVIVNAIGFYLQSSDYKMVCHLCRIATYNNIFDNDKIFSLFSKIRDFIPLGINELDTQQFNRCVFNVKEILLEAKYNLTKVQVYIDTNLKEYSDENLSVILNTIDNTLKNYDVASKKIEIRHNSPLKLLLEFVALILKNNITAEIINSLIESLSLISSVITIRGSFKEKLRKNNKKEERDEEHREKLPTLSITIVVEN